MSCWLDPGIHHPVGERSGEPEPADYIFWKLNNFPLKPFDFQPFVRSFIRPAAGRSLLRPGALHVVMNSVSVSVEQQSKYKCKIQVKGIHSASIHQQDMQKHIWVAVTASAGEILHLQFQLKHCSSSCRTEIFINFGLFVYVHMLPEWAAQAREFLLRLGWQWNSCFFFGSAFSCLMCCNWTEYPFSRSKSAFPHEPDSNRRGMRTTLT